MKLPSRTGHLGPSLPRPRPRLLSLRRRHRALPSPRTRTRARRPTPRLLAHRPIEHHRDLERDARERERKSQAAEDVKVPEGAEGVLDLV